MNVVGTDLPNCQFLCYTVLGLGGSLCDHTAWVSSNTSVHWRNCKSRFCWCQLSMCVRSCDIKYTVGMGNVKNFMSQYCKWQNFWGIKFLQFLWIFNKPNKLSIPIFGFLLLEFFYKKDAHCPDSGPTGQEGGTRFTEESNKEVASTYFGKVAMPFQITCEIFEQVITDWQKWTARV